MTSELDHSMSVEMFIQERDGQSKGHRFRFESESAFFYADNVGRGDNSRQVITIEGDNSDWETDRDEEYARTVKIVIGKDLLSDIVAHALEEGLDI